MQRIFCIIFIFLFLFSPLAVFAQAESTPAPTDTQVFVIPVYLFATQEGGALAITPVAENQYFYAHATSSEKVETGLINPTGTATADQPSTELGNQPVIPMGLLLVALGSNPDAVNSFLETGEGVGQRIFSSKIFDNDSNGLSYFGARYYSGEAGKFVSQDAVFQELGGEKFYKLVDNNYQDDNDMKKKLLKDFISNPQSLNSYSYVNNNPLHFIDPTGNLLVNDSGASQSDKQTFQQGLQQVVNLVSNNQEVQDYFSTFGVNIMDVLTNDKSGPAVNLNSIFRILGYKSDNPGWYSSITKGIYLNQGAFKSSDSIGQTLIHELGHWANNLGQGWGGERNPEISQFKTSSGIGVDSGVMNMVKRDYIIRDGLYGYAPQLLTYKTIGWSMTTW